MQNSGIIFYKKENNKLYFLLIQDNLTILNKKNKLYSDIGDKVKNLNDNVDDIALLSFYENTLGLSYSFKELQNLEKQVFTNPKYNYQITFINKDIDNDTLDKINKARNYLNSNIINNENILNKKICNPNINISNTLKWFELSEILNYPQNFENKFMNTFLKSLKNKTILI
tara:strand:+ start:155 stop:667 length:513 start_codon:yes stop_codon:yes gene_type:complete